ncbi:phage tail tape measure protein [Pseudodesulfovibrio pelocollis]|uniref:phage tail tape measure protein n=1 Tax=Pseudodesulfovibrio pelocollis TaxID=3051432 RepID=UPI00255AF4F4|nr:phage tail tape measure protein [Pseudodesulfovibrio sp. SB368]
MSAKTVAFSFAIGAALGPSFTSTVSQGKAGVKQLGQSIAEIKGDAVYKAGAAFYRLRDQVRTSRAELGKAEADLAGLRQEAAAAGGASELMGRRIAQAEARVKQMRTASDRAASSFLDQRARMRSMGQSLGEVSAGYRKASAEVDKLTKAQERQARAAKQQQDLLSSRGEYRSRMTDVAAMGAVALSPVVASARAGRSATRLGTVLNAEDRAEASRLGREAAQDAARTGLASLQEAFDIQYALNSAGLDAGLARAATSVVAKVSTVTAGSHERVGEVIATTYNNLGSALEGTAAEKIDRIGDLLTKAQLKFQIRDFGQLGESMTEGAAGLANYNVNLEQGVTLLGQLNTAGLQGSRAGTALNAVLRQLPKAAAKWNIEMVRDARGQLDMIATLKQLGAALDGLDTDARAVALQEVFGDEGAKGVVPLLNKLGELDAALADVAESSRGIVDREVLAFQEDSMGQWNRMTNTAVVLGDALGKTLLPGVNMVLSVIGGGLGLVAGLASEHETLTSVIGGVVVGFLAMRMATLAYGYVSTFVVGGVRDLRRAVLWLTTASVRARVATVALAVAQRAWAIGSAIVTGAAAAMTTGLNILRFAVMTNPIGLVITGIALAAGLLMTRWEPARKFFVGLWDTVAGAIGRAWDALKGVAGWVTSVPVIGDLLTLGGKAVSLLFGGEAGPVMQPAAEPRGGGAQSAIPSGSGGGGGLTLNFPIHLGDLPPERAGSLGQKVEQAVRRVLPQIIEEEKRLAYN